MGAAAITTMCILGLMVLGLIFILVLVMRTNKYVTDENDRLKTLGSTDSDEAVYNVLVLENQLKNALEEIKRLKGCGSY